MVSLQRLKSLAPPVQVSHKGSPVVPDLPKSLILSALPGPGSLSGLSAPAEVEESFSSTRTLGMGWGTWASCVGGSCCHSSLILFTGAGLEVAPLPPP